MCDKIKAKIGRPLWLTMVLIIVVGGVVINIFFFYLVTWRHLMSGMWIKVSVSTCTLPETVVRSNVGTLWLHPGRRSCLAGKDE